MEFRFYFYYNVLGISTGEFLNRGKPISGGAIWVGELSAVKMAYLLQRLLFVESYFDWASYL